MEPEPVAVVLAGLVQRGVVAGEAVDGAVVGDADEQRAALPAVEERGDRLERRRLEGLVDLAGVGPGAQRRLVLEVVVLTAGAEQLADRAVLLVSDPGLALDQWWRRPDGRSVARSSVVEELERDLLVAVEPVEHAVWNPRRTRP